MLSVPLATLHSTSTPKPTSTIRATEAAKNLGTPPVRIFVTALHQRRDAKDGREDDANRVPKLVNLRTSFH
jgi:hypothetical protein